MLKVGLTWLRCCFLLCFLGNKYGLLSRFLQDGYSDSIRTALEILKLGGTLTVAQRILEAVAFERNKKYEEAQGIFDSVWDQHRDAFTFDAIQSYLNALLQRSQDAKILAVLNDAELMLGFYPGMGMAESGSFERLGRYRESLLAAYKEIYYAYYYDGISLLQIHQNLDRVGATLVPSLPEAERAQIRLLITGLKAHASGDNLRANQIFQQQLRETSYPFGQFLLLSSQIGTMDLPIPTQAIANLVSLELRFKTHPGYYRALWNSMKLGSGDYRFSVVREVLEKTILLNPQGPAAMEARNEIVRLLNLSVPAQEFRLPQEILPLIQQEIETGSDGFLTPLVTMLSSGSHYYSDSLIIAMGNAERNSGYNITRVLRRYSSRMPDVVVNRLMQSGLL
jgi:hypothetical protein